MLLGKGKGNGKGKEKRPITLVSGVWTQHLKDFSILCDEKQVRYYVTKSIVVRGILRLTYLSVLKKRVRVVLDIVNVTLKYPAK